MSNGLPSIAAPSQADALTPNVLRALDGASLIAFLLERRWFGAKAGKPRSAKIVDIVPLPWDNGTFAIARVAVQTEDNIRYYQLPLALRAGLTTGPKAVVAKITWP